MWFCQRQEDTRSEVEVIGSWKNCYRLWELINLWFRTKLLSIIFLVLFNLQCICIKAGLGNTSAEICLPFHYPWMSATGFTRGSSRYCGPGFTKIKGINEDYFDRCPRLCAAMGVSPAGHILPAGEKSNTFWVSSCPASPPPSPLPGSLQVSQHTEESQGF